MPRPGPDRATPLAAAGAPKPPAAGNPAPPAYFAWARVGLVIIAGLLTIYRFTERDFWFHLAAGRSIAEHGLPQSEAWCLAARGQWPWLGEWLFHLALFTTWKLGGMSAIAVWRALWAALAMALALVLARRLDARTWALPALALLTLAVTRDRQTARPEQLTSVFVLLYITVFESARQSGRDRTWWLIPASVLWANLHPGWIWGPVIGWMYAAGEMLGASPEGRVRARRWALLGIVLYAAAAVTPRPLDTLTLRLVRDAGSDPARSTIQELEPWTWERDHASPFSAFVILAAIAAAYGGARAMRRSPALGIASIFGLAAGCAAYRFRALGVMVSFPLIAVALEQTRADRYRQVPEVVTRVAAIAAVAALVISRPYFPLGVAAQEFAIPTRAVAIADSLGLDGPVLNTSWYGGYILWVRGEAHPPLVDARNLGSAVFRWRLARAYSEPAALDTLLGDWPFTHAILEPATDPGNRLVTEMARRREWALLFSDDAALLFVRRDLYPAAVASRGYQLLTPDYDAMASLCGAATTDSTLARRIGAELERARAESPWHARASLWLGLLELARGRGREAVVLLDEVERLAPLTPGLAFRQGLAREAIGDRAGARTAYRRALREPADADAARRGVARMR